MEQSTPYHTTPSINDSGMSLKEMILKGKEYFFLLWRNKWWIISLAILGAGVMFLKDKLAKNKYEARLTFSLNEGDGPSTASLSGLLGQFGLGGGASTGKVSYDKIVELSKSMRIANKALFEKVTVNGHEDYIANHIFDIYGFAKPWSKYDPYFKDFHFKSDDIDSFNLKEKSALKNIYSFTIGGLKPGLVTCGYDTKSTIFTISATTLHEDLSLALADKFFNHLSQFYIQQSNDKQLNTYNLVKSKADSLFRRWTGSEYSVSRQEQSSNALWSPVDRTNRNIQQKQTTIYSMAYSEALKNLEIADYALKNATPFIRAIDRPFAPLYPIGPNLIKDLILGIILGSGLACAFILGKYFVKQALKS